MSFKSYLERYRCKNFHKLRIICYVSIWLTLLALCNQRISASVALIGFVKYLEPQVEEKDKIQQENCPERGKSTSVPEGKKEEWPKYYAEIANVGYNLGYMFGHVPGTFLTVSIGIHLVMVITIFTCSLLNLCCIWATFSFPLFTFLRILAGFISGSMYPIINEAVAVYSPKNERHIVHMFVHTANFVSASLVFPLGGYFMQYVQDGWKYIFIGTAAFGFFVGIFWTIFVWSEPDENIFMSRSEQNFIRESLYPKGKPPKKTLSNFPYKKMFTDIHLYINSSCHFGKLMILYMNLLGVVVYFRDIFKLSSVMSGIYGVIPFLGECFLQLSYASIMDMVIKKRLSGSNLRKLHTLIGCVGTFTFLLCSFFVGCDDLVLGILFQTLSLMFVAPFQCGYFLAIIERYGRFSGITFSFINIAGSFSGLVQRGITLIFKLSMSDVRAAQLSFLVTAIVSLVFCMPYIIFGTADVADWVESASKATESKPVEKLKKPAEAFESNETV